MNEKWMTEALAQRGITYAPVYLRARPGMPKKKSKAKLAFVYNKPSLVSTFTCAKCNQKFDERSHLIAHNKYVHLAYGDDKNWLDRHRCDICQKLFVDKKYVETHKMSVHFKQRTQECRYCNKMFTSVSALRHHKKRVHLEQSGSAAASTNGDGPQAAPDALTTTEIETTTSDQVSI